MRSSPTGARASRPQRVRFGAKAAVLAAVVVAALLLFDRSLHRGLTSYAPSRLILDRHGAYFGEVPGESEALGYWPVPYVLPDRVVQATLETEDRRFYEHGGVHLPSVLRAALQAVKSREIVSGASTIAMQVARMQTPGPRTVLRKLREAAEAELLISDEGHERVLRQYLTIAPYGNRVRGVVRAARLYFDKPVEDLSWLQAAFLAGLPQMPGRMNPWDEAGLKRALKRAHRVLTMLHLRGVITDEELSQALKSDLGLVPQPHRRPEALHAVLEWSAEIRKRADVLAYSTLDLDAQEKVAAILRRHLETLEPSGAGNAAALVLDTKSGDVLAYVGSRDYFDAENKGAINFLKTRRSPGSTLKPFIYGLALESGKFTAASELADTAVEFTEANGRTFVPENITHTFLGPMLLREALGNSRNIPAMRVLSEVGVEPALRFFEKAGVRGIRYAPDAYGLSLATGALEVSVEELASLYAVLANDGRALPLRHFLSDEPKPGEVLISADAARLVSHILADPLARRPSFPAGSVLDFPYAVSVKTGTSQGYRDAWTVAYSDRLLVAVWVGNHDWRRMNGLGGLSAAAGPAHEIMDALMPTRSPHIPVATSVALPAHFVERSICPLSGKLAGEDCPDARQEHFVPGTEPFEICGVHGEVAIDRRNGLRATAACPAKYVVKKPMLDLPPLYADWARHAHLEVAPTEVSPLCEPQESVARVAIREPKNKSRFLWDPDTPPEQSAIRLAASVTPSTEPIVWVIDGVPVAKVEYPYELRWPLAKGRHVIRAELANRPLASKPVVVQVDD